MIHVVLLHRSNQGTAATRRQSQRERKLDARLGSAVWQHHWRQPVIVCFTHSQAAGSQARVRGLKAFKTARAALNVQRVDMGRAHLFLCGHSRAGPSFFSSRLSPRGMCLRRASSPDTGECA
jgi:hypothetical protein